MEKNNHHKGPGFMNGFFFGIIVGAAVVFLLGTKKGKKILKLLTETGVEGVADLEEMLAESEDEEEFEQEYSAEGEELEPNPLRSAHEQEVKPGEHRPLKRFFRGIKKMNSN